MSSVVKRVPFEQLTQEIADQIMAMLPDHDRLSVAMFHRKGLDVTKYATSYQINYSFPEIFKVHDDTAVFYLMYEEDRLVAFSFGVKDNGSFGYDNIGGICVDSSRRRAGISYKLMNYVIKEFDHAWFQHKGAEYNSLFEKAAQ